MFPRAVTSAVWVADVYLAYKCPGISGTFFPAFESRELISLLGWLLYNYYNIRHTQWGDLSFFGGAELRAGCITLRWAEMIERKNASFLRGFS